MNGPSGINPWTSVSTTPPATKVKRAVPAEVQERLLLARLFGQQDEPAPPPAKAVTPGQPNDDELAPNLGRHLDVVA
jgi:hypothetical protein